MISQAVKISFLMMLTFYANVNTEDRETKPLDVPTMRPEHKKSTKAPLAPTTAPLEPTNKKKATTGNCIHKWMKLDNDQLSKLGDLGVFVGNYKNNAPAYVGRGKTNCWGTTPGRFTSEGKVYFPCSGKEAMDDSDTAELLIFNSSQTYKWSHRKPNNISESVLPKLVTMEGIEGRTLAVARLNITDKKLHSATFSQVVVAIIGTPESRYFNPNDGKAHIRKNKQVEMLMCSVG